MASPGAPFLCFSTPTARRHTMDDMERIAKGGQPKAWTCTRTHPVHGELEFTANMPTAEDWLRHAVMQEQFAPGGVSGPMALLAEAVAGLLTLIKCPVVDRKTHEDPDTPGHERVELTYYNPATEPDFELVVGIWVEFFAWRNGLLHKDRVGELKNSSGATGTDETDAASPAGTDSLPSTSVSPA